MAVHIANAIENARLYENLREQARALSLLHEAARELKNTCGHEPLRVSGATGEGVGAAMAKLLGIIDEAREKEREVAASEGWQP